MITMLEKMILAMRSSVGDRLLCDLEGDTVLIDGSVDLAALARAALQAIRETNEPMIAAAFPVAYVAQSSATDETLAAIWAAMIDAILEEKT